MTPEQLQKLRDERQAKLAEARKIAEQPTQSDDDVKRFEALMVEEKGLQVRLDRLAQVGERETAIRQPEARQTVTTNTDALVQSMVTTGGLTPNSITERHAPITILKGGNTPENRLKMYTWGQMLKASFGHGNKEPNLKAQQWCKDHGINYAAAMSTVDNTQGGSFVFDSFAATVIDLVEDYGVFPRYADRAPMPSDTLSWPRVTAGLTAYPLSEGVAGTSSNPTTDSVQLVAKGWGTLTPVPRELLDDSSINIAELLGRKSALAHATKIDACGFIGDGGGATYQGIQGVASKINDGNHASGIFTGATGHTAFSTLTVPDFLGCLGKLSMIPGIRPMWFISNFGYATSMAALKYAAGGTVGELAGPTGPSFLGYPVVISQVLNTTAGADVSAIKCLFGDMSMAATYGDRRAFGMERDDSLYFDKRQAAFLGWMRYDINVHDIGGAAGVLTPMVALKTPGS